MNRDKLQDDLIHAIVDSMDHKTLYQCVYDYLADNYNSYSEAALITEVEDYYPELLN
jgi:hypothetical protein